MKGMGRQMEGKEKSKLEEGKAISEGAEWRVKRDGVLEEL